MALPKDQGLRIAVIFLRLNRAFASAPTSRTHPPERLRTFIRATIADSRLPLHWVEPERKEEAREKFVHHLPAVRWCPSSTTLQGSPQALGHVTKDAYAKKYCFDWSSKLVDRCLAKSFTLFGDDWTDSGRVGWACRSDRHCVLAVNPNWKRGM